MYCVACYPIYIYIYIYMSQVECWSDPFCLRGVRGKLITTTLCVIRCFYWFSLIPRPATHWKYNIVSLQKRNYYNILSFGLDVSPHPVVDNERLTGRLGSTGPRRGITQFTNYLQKTTNNVNITNYHLIMKDMK